MIKDALTGTFFAEADNCLLLSLRKESKEAERTGGSLPHM